jgi:hypothetical protein
VFIPSSLPNIYVSDPILVSSFEEDSEDENPLPPAHLPPIESIEQEPTPTPSLPIIVPTT